MRTAEQWQVFVCANVVDSSANFFEVLHIFTHHRIIVRYALCAVLCMSLKHCMHSTEAAVWAAVLCVRCVCPTLYIPWTMTDEQYYYIRIVLSEYERDPLLELNYSSPSDSIGLAWWEWRVGNPRCNFMLRWCNILYRFDRTFHSPSFNFSFSFFFVLVPFCRRRRLQSRSSWLYDVGGMQLAEALPSARFDAMNKIHYEFIECQ